MESLFFHAEFISFFGGCNFRHTFMAHIPLFLWDAEVMKHVKLKTTFSHIVVINIVDINIEVKL